MKEIFAIPCVGAIIEKQEGTDTYVLIQTRQKQDGAETNGLIELPAGKIRAYEHIFTALRREVWEETGLHITKIHGEEGIVSTETDGHTTVSYTPYCVTQNLSGAYSIILHTFLCEAEGELLKGTDETRHIRWIKTDELQVMLTDAPQRFFIMHINPLKQYLHNKYQSGFQTNGGNKTMQSNFKENP